MIFSPVGFTVLVRPDPIEEQVRTERIVIPDTVKSSARLETHTGRVVKVSDLAWHGVADNRPWCKIGDHILYAKYGGKFITDPKTKEEVLLIPDKDVLGVIGE